MATDEPIFCRTCRDPLTSVKPAAGPQTWIHGQSLVTRQAPDHQPDPVPLSQLPGANQVCDFCNESNPLFVYRAQRQETETARPKTIYKNLTDYRDKSYNARTVRTEGSSILEQGYSPDWAACAGCAELIEARDLNGLVFRVMQNMPAKLTRRNRLVQTRADLFDRYGTLFKEMKPGRGRITKENPLGEWDE